MLFSHLHQYERELSISRNLPVVGGPIHPAVLELGLRSVVTSGILCPSLYQGPKKWFAQHI